MANVTQPFWKIMLKTLFPAHTWNIPRHVFGWASASFVDGIWNNPNFNSKQFGNGITIYCIHGTADRRYSFSLMAARLIEKGLPDYISCIRLVEFKNRFRPGNTVESLADQVLEQIAENGDTNVIFAGHSRGGLVAAECACRLQQRNELEPAKPVKTHAIFAICSPFMGAFSAYFPPFNFYSSVHEMQINSPYLKNLRAKIEQLDIPIHCFGATHDGIVSPDSAAMGHKNSHGNFSYTELNHGHLSAMSSHILVDEVKKDLDAINFKKINNASDTKISESMTLIAKTLQTSITCETVTSLAEKAIGTIDQQSNHALLDFLSKQIARLAKTPRAAILQNIHSQLQSDEITSHRARELIECAMHHHQDQGLLGLTKLTFLRRTQSQLEWENWQRAQKSDANSVKQLTL